MDMRTPLGRVRGLGSAKEGADHFWRQRLTALANVPLALFLGYTLIRYGGADYAEVAAHMASPLVAIPMLLVVISSIIHMRLGMRVIIEDYVSSEAWKIVSLIANSFFSYAVGLACLFAILKLSFGA